MSGPQETQTPIVVNARTGDVEVGTPRPVGLNAPGSFANSALWFIITVAFATVMVGAALTLMAEFLAPGQVQQRAVDASMILLLFSTPSAFLAGLVIPSPLQRR